MIPLVWLASLLPAHPAQVPLLSDILASALPPVPGLDLALLRLPASTQVADQPRSPPLPSNFMPLCGNGRLDTASDYQAYYSRPGAQPALSLPGYAIPDADRTKTVALQIWPDETCDDGNTADYDGCSADCMHKDLWTSACQLRLDRDIPAMEAILHTGGRTALLSAASGLYSVNLYPEPGDTAVQTDLLQGKTFAVTDLFFSGTVLLYSAPQQRLWQWAGGALSQVKDFPLKPWTTHAYQAGDWLVMNDDETVAAYNTVSGSLATCKPGTLMDPGCIYLLVMGGDTVVMACGFDRVIIGLAPSLTCPYIHYAPDPSTNAAKTIWDDAFQAVQNVLFARQQRYSMTVQSSIPVGPPYYLDVYTPMGLWAEVPLNSPRGWVNVNSTQTPPITFLGDSSLLLASRTNNVACYAGARCVFDMSPQYDLLGGGLDLQGSWQGVLQYVILKMTQGTGVTDFAALRGNAALYSAVMGQWSAVFSQIVLPRVVFSSLKHPASNNLWAVRADGLYEVTKSGVPVQVGGKCMPSNVALCPYCQWAAAGGRCAPCSVASPSSQAWVLQCSSGCSTGRRLLQAAQSLQTVPIEFVVGGNDADLAPALSGVPCMGGAVWTLQAPQVWKVRLQTTDPVGCMQALNPVLRTMHVLVPPSSPIVIQTTHDSQPLGVGAIVGISLGCVAVAGLAVAAALGPRTFRPLGVHFGYPVHRYQQMHPLGEHLRNPYGCHAVDG